jgi:hypothetical protein
LPGRLTPARKTGEKIELGLLATAAIGSTGARRVMDSSMIGSGNYELSLEPALKLPKTMS